jgi:hypothetical protein
VNRSDIDAQRGPSVAQDARPPVATTVSAEHSFLLPVGLRVCVIVPALNEGASVGSVVASVARSLPGAQVVVIDDGSTDDTGARALEAGAVVVPLPVNVGIGGAVQTGYRFAARNGFDIAVQIDGDGQHDPAEMHLLLGPIIRGEADMSVGSRWLGRGDYLAPRGRRFGMRVLAALVTWRAGAAFTDTTSGFRAVGRNGIALFAEHYPPDFPEVETIVLGCRHDIRIVEVPVRMTHREHGTSSISGFRSGYFMARVILALLVGSTTWSGT